MLFHDLLKSLFGKPRSRRAIGPKRAELAVEQLEDRLAPATLVWAPAVNAVNPVWSNPVNWVDPNNKMQHPKAPPGKADTAIFTADQKLGGKDASCSMDVFTSVDGFRIEASFTSIVTLTRDVQVVSSFTMAGGTISGDLGRLGIGGGAPKVGPPAPAIFTWTGGTIGGKRTITLGPGTAGTISGTGKKVLNGRQMVIADQADITWTDGNITLQNFKDQVAISVSGKFVATGRAGKITDNGTTGGIKIFSTGSFQSAAQGIIILNTFFRTEGKTNVTMGTLVLSAGSSFGGAEDYEIADKAMLTFQGTKEHFLNAGSNLTGKGAVNFVADTVTLLGVVTVENATQSRGTIGGNTLFITGIYTWTGGKWENTKTIVLSSDPKSQAELKINGAVQLAADLINRDLVTWMKGDITVLKGGQIDNNGTGIFDIQTDNKITNKGGGNFTNVGLVTKSKGNAQAKAEILIPFVNTGMLELDAGVLKIPTMGQKEKDALKAATKFNGGDLNTDGLFQLEGGIVESVGASALTAEIYGDVNNTGGQMEPGGAGSPGIITIDGTNGTYTQSGSGALDIDIGGTAAGTEYDQLIVAGAATLGGNLNVQLINGFTPADTDTFTVMTYGSLSGAFAQQSFDLNGITFYVFSVPNDPANPTGPGSVILATLHAADDTFSVCAGATATGNVLTNDSYPQSLPITVNLVSSSAPGLTLNPDGSLAYDAPSGSNRDVSFTYNFTAGGVTSNTATGTIHITPPTPANLSFSASAVEGGFLTISGSFNCNCPDALASMFAATLNENGTNAALPLTPNGSGGFSFSFTGSTVYPEEGQSVPVAVGISGPGGSISGSGTITVSDASLTGTPETVSGTEGTPLNDVLIGSFTDANRNPDSGDFSTATVTWGDGTPAETLPVVSLGGGNFQIVGSHTYAEESPAPYTIVITASDAGGSTVTINSTANVSDADLSATGTNTISAVENTPLASVVLGTVQDANPNADGSDLSVSADWGDGSAPDSNVTLTAQGNGAFLLTAAAHTYAEEGIYTATVSIADAGGSTASATTRVTVADAALTSQAVPTLSGTAGVPLSQGLVGAFTDANTAAPTSDFTATINWGDGSPSTAGTLTQPGGPGTAFQVTAGSHTCTQAGHYVITTAVVDQGGATATLTTPITITSTATVPSITGVSPTSGGPGTIVTLTGSGLTGTVQVNFGGTPAAGFTVLSDTQVTATAPAGLTGTVAIMVTTPGGTSSPSTNAVFTYAPVTTGPVITSITPTVIQSGAAYFLMVYGSGFSGTTEILVGSLVVTSFALVSDGQIELAENGGLPGTVDVRVITPQGESPITPADQLTFVAALPAPTVTGVSPNNGSSAGGTTVIITGANLTGVSQVFFGGLVAASSTVESATTIQATTPASPMGTVDVTVVSPGGTSATSLADQFTFTTANPLTPLAVTPSAAVTLDPAVSAVRPWYHHHAHHHQPAPEHRDEWNDDKRDSSDRDTEPMADVDSFFAEYHVG